MKVIIPMAGIGKRLRPLTLTTPKPLINIAGKSIVEWLVSRIALITDDDISDIAFIIGNFPYDITDDLNKIGQQLNAKVHIYIQEEALGTAHAISFASDLLQGPVIIAFADTLFDSSVKFSPNADVVIWTKNVKNPQAYGVVLKNNDGFINRFVEKPKNLISNEAIIGIYYFKNGELLKNKIYYILKNKILENNEYQLTNALQMLLDDGLAFVSYPIDEWLDCGNIDLLLNTMKYVLSNFIANIKTTFQNNGSILIQPVYIGNNVNISNSIIGPNVSIEDNSVIENSILSNSLILSNSKLINFNLSDSAIGNFVSLTNSPKKINVGDFTQTKI